MKAAAPRYRLLALLLACCSFLFAIPCVCVQVTGQTESFLAFYGVFCGALAGVLAEKWLGVWRGFTSHSIFVSLVFIFGFVALSAVIPVSFGLVPEASEANLEYLSSRGFDLRFVRGQLLPLFGYSWGEHPLHLSADLFVAAFSCSYLALGVERLMQPKPSLSESTHEEIAKGIDKYALLAVLLVFLNGALATISGFNVLGDGPLQELKLLALLKASSIISCLVCAAAVVAFVSVWKRRFSSIEFDSYVLSGFLFASFACGCLLGAFAVSHFAEVVFLGRFGSALKLLPLVISAVIALFSICISVATMRDNKECG